MRLGPVKRGPSGGVRERFDGMTFNRNMVIVNYASNFKLHCSYQLVSCRRPSCLLIACGSSQSLKRVLL